MLTDIYAASEEPIPGVTVEALAASINGARSNPVRVVQALDDIPDVLAALAQPGDFIITMGAGSIGAIPPRVVDALRHRFERDLAARGGAA